MKGLLVTSLASLLLSSSDAFTPALLREHRPRAAGTMTTTVADRGVVRLFATEQETEAEALRRKARELLEEANKAEEQLRSTLSSKKSRMNDETDLIIDQLFPMGTDDSGLVDRLRQKRLSTAMLTRIIERLNEREISAKGLEHVEASSHHDHTQFKVVAEPNEEELARVKGLIDKMISAAEILDKEWWDKKKASAEKHVTHAEMMHWAAGDVAKTLRAKAKDLGREHDEQFKKRLQSFYDAAHKKEHEKKDQGGDKGSYPWNTDEV